MKNCNDIWDALDRLNARMEEIDAGLCLIEAHLEQLTEALDKDMDRRSINSWIRTEMRTKKEKGALILPKNAEKKM